MPDSILVTRSYNLVILSERDSAESKDLGTAAKQNRQRLSCCSAKILRLHFVPLRMTHFYFAA